MEYASEIQTRRGWKEDRRREPSEVSLDTDGLSSGYSEQRQRQQRTRRAEQHPPAKTSGRTRQQYSSTSAGGRSQGRFVEEMK